MPPVLVMSAVLLAVSLASPAGIAGMTQAPESDEGRAPVQTPAPGAHAAMAFENVRLVAMDGKPARDGWTVLVRDGRIEAMGPRQRLRVPADARRIDGAGRSLVPGLIDMHVHLPPQPGEDGDPTWRTLGLMLANGITTTRSMAGHPAHPALRDRQAAGEIDGPRLVLAAPALHDGNVQDPEAARERVRAARAAGFDLVKSHHITDVATWQAVQDEARAQGLPVAGHVSGPVTLDQALAAGQQVEHLDGWIAALVPDGAPERQIAFGQLPPPEVLAAVDPARIAPLARRMAAEGHHDAPTLALFEASFGGEAAGTAARARPELRYVAPAARAAWAAQEAQLAAIPGIAEIAPRFSALRRDIVRALAEAGAPMMAGSDSPQSYSVPGFALHHELEALQAAGLSAEQALATATRNPAHYLAATAVQDSALATAPPLGVIAPGAAADLVLVDGRPDEDVGALTEIAGVMHGGRWLDRSDLDALLARIEASVVTPASASPQGSPHASNATAAASATPAAHIWIVRHAEAGSGPDPALTPSGAVRADAWHARLGAPTLARIYASDTRRARETAEGIALDSGAPVELYDPAQPAALIDTLRRRGEPAVVVGHSNTINALAALLGETRALDPVGHAEHDRVYALPLR